LFFVVKPPPFVQKSADFEQKMFFLRKKSKKTLAGLKVSCIFAAMKSVF